MYWQQVDTATNLPTKSLLGQNIELETQHREKKSKLIFNIYHPID
jgi:hypothetical protein